MSDVSRRSASRLGSGLVLMLAVGMLGGAAEAAVGNVLWTVDIPAGAQCGTTSGTAVAVVPGGKVGLPKIQTLLVTSCVQAGQAKLFFLDPSTDPATLVKTIVTTVNPSNGWASLTVRPDQVDLIGCTMVGSTPNVYSIDFSSIPPNNTADGTATLLFTGPAGSTCDGLTRDIAGSPKTIYESSGANISHLPDAGSPSLGSIPAGCPGAMTGVAVGTVSSAMPAFSGPVLYVACPDAAPTIHQIDKTTGSLVTSVEIPLGSFALPTTQPGDVECDPVTFAVSQSWHPGIRNKDVLWVKDAANPIVYAMELPFAACGPVPPPPTPTANACDLTIDTDGDGLPDCWEDGKWWLGGLPGIALDGVYILNRADTSQRFTLCVNGTTDCATPLQRDVFVEIDYMQQHRPNATSVSDVVTGFAGAPAFLPGSGKCDVLGCSLGIRLHVQIDEEFPHVVNTALVACTGPKALSDADFDAIKSATAFATGGFGTPTERLPANLAALNAKRLAFHYGLFVHNQSPTPPATTSSNSGCAELFGNDFMVSLGAWDPDTTNHPLPGGVGSRAQQAGTFMHELGHNLGLRHGGVDNVNCKPQHLSVMNYAYQFPNAVTTRPLSYSSEILGVDPTLQCGLPAGPKGLNEACLQEAAGIGNPSTVTITFGPPVGVPAKTSLTSVVVPGGTPVNWNKNASSADVNVVRDLNSMTSFGCPARAVPEGSSSTCSVTNPSACEFLEGSNDWQMIQLNMRASADFADGVSLNFDPPDTNGTKEARFEDLLDLSHDLIDIKPADKNNTINLGTTSTFLVAIFSRKSPDGMTVDVDATTIDPATITLRGIPPGPEWSLTVRDSDCKTQDINKDGIQDLVCKFRWMPGPVVSPGLQTAVLSGTTSDGYNFLSSDVIRFVP